MEIVNLALPCNIKFFLVNFVLSKGFLLTATVLLFVLLYLTVWYEWYKIKMVDWNLDYHSSSSHRERKHLRFERKIMRLYAIPFFFLVWWLLQRLGIGKKHHKKHSAKSGFSEHHQRPTSFNGGFLFPQSSHRHHHHHHENHGSEPKSNEAK